MQNFVKKFELVVDALEKFGPVPFFGLFERVDSTEKWDVIIGAPWLDPDASPSFKLINLVIQRFVKTGSPETLTRVVILREDNPLEKLLQNTWTGKGLFQLKDTKILAEIFPFKIKSAYLLRCTKKD